MGNVLSISEAKVAVLVDCDNTSPAILEYALRVVAKFGRVVVKRGYGNHSNLTKTWQDALVQAAFTPCLQYQYASGKNTADIALALDALEVLFDQRADCFCIVTSDSDFAYLCRKLRERGASVYIVGESKTPLALRNASEQFFEWSAVENVDQPSSGLAPQPSGVQNLARSDGLAVKPTPKRRPKFIVEAVELLTSDTSEGKVSLGILGQYLKRTDPAFSPNLYGHSGLLDMLKKYDLLSLKKEEGGHYTVMLNQDLVATDSSHHKGSEE